MTTKTFTPSQDRAYDTHPEKKLALYYTVTGLIFLLVGVLMGPLQALNYAGIDIYKYMPFLKSYYQGLTLHGVLNALVFTTYFICGILLYIPARDLKLRPNLGFAWFTYWLMNFGVVLAAIAILGNNASVLYTFYPPLKGSPLFYIGAAILVASSLLVGGQVIYMWTGWKKANPGKITPVTAYMSVATWFMWMLASLGIVVEVVVYLIPWSLGWTPAVDPLLARTLFWFTGHPIVYFWLLPAYVSWYAFIPNQAGGKIVSEPLARLAFAMFLLVSVPVGLHHQFTDPGISNLWKIIHMVLTFMVAVPSMLTAFSVAASMEYAARLKGGKGLTKWIAKLPWNNPSFTAQVLAMISFIFGGAGGIVNASMSLDYVVHNTAWIPGHFHITVGTAVTLTFFGMTFWLLPHLTGKKLFNPKLAVASAWWWFVGMMVFALGMHWEGLLGIPRRAHISALPVELLDQYAKNAQIPMALTGISGMILLIASIMYYVVVAGTLWGNQRDVKNAPEIPFSESLAPVDHRKSVRVMDNLWVLFLIAFVIVLGVYLPVIVPMLQSPNLVPGMRLW
ncbi:b(o/a)3-type cytochrome-c oxidase subunit 1 [Deinococcus cellulosilyticus]|uniref:Cytochrome c oxidase subunit 1 n=1 Tax=Deinococcus cellulosilyticus (strain DSM 18568 / NBRC 106333 / KACC 11606 / 5516J-15) TaxID=1223518 RepID=A0A511MY61_DEIC1|nr:b(o/a)3-type cytochrome-c oxidase subunit 1 [Deinococcus cellulosilyticus]GEM45535.1 cytochrome c oxidase subunit 1 [Deinococcus cellulosilyticus NBRC 106333 = KACC 11606]